MEGYSGGTVNIIEWDFVVDGDKDGGKNEDGEKNEVTNTQKPVDGFKLGQLVLAHGKFQARLATIHESTLESLIV